MDDSEAGSGGGFRSSEEMIRSIMMSCDSTGKVKREDCTMVEIGNGDMTLKSNNTVIKVAYLTSGLKQSCHL